MSLLIFLLKSIVLCSTQSEVPDYAEHLELMEQERDYLGRAFYNIIRFKVTLDLRGKDVYNDFLEKMNSELGGDYVKRYGGKPRRANILDAIFFRLEKQRRIRSTNFLLSYWFEDIVNKTDTQKLRKKLRSMIGNDAGLTKAIEKFRIYSIDFRSPLFFNSPGTRFTYEFLEWLPKEENRHRLECYKKIKNGNIFERVAGIFKELHRDGDIVKYISDHKKNSYGLEDVGQTVVNEMIEYLDRLAEEDILKEKFESMRDWAIERFNAGCEERLEMVVTFKLLKGCLMQNKSRTSTTSD